MISPAIYFENIQIHTADSVNATIAHASTIHESAIDHFLPKDATLQAAGFVSDRMSKLFKQTAEFSKVQDKAFETAENADANNISDTDSVASAAESEASGVTGNSPRSDVSTPRGSNKPFSNPTAAFVPSKLGTAVTTSQSFDSITPKSTVNSSFFTTSSFEQPTFAATAAAVTPAGTVATEQPSAGAFDDMFSGFSAKPPVVPLIDTAAGRQHNSVRSEITASLQDELICILKSGKIEKFDFFAILSIALGNDANSNGTVKVEVRDPSMQVASYLVHPSVAIKAEVSDHASRPASTERRIGVIIPTNKKPILAVKLPYIVTFRPMLFQVRTSTVWTGNVAAVTIRIVINPNFKQYVIEAFVVNVSLSSLKLPGTTEPAAIKGVQLKPNGTYSNTSNVVSWTTARFNPASQSQVLMEAAVSCRVDGEANSIEIADNNHLQVILKGKYSTNLISGLDYSIDSVEYLSSTGTSNLSREFELTTSKLKRTKFEYRFM